MIQSMPTMQVTAKPLMPSEATVSQFPGVIGTFMGRDALSLANTWLKLEPSDTVLLPAFTCKDVVKSYATKVKVVFYDIQPDLSIDPDVLRAKIKASRPRMILITDYFGFLQPYRHQIRQLCDDHDVCLIEDCAHSLLTKGAGELGDFAIYSFRKILPVPDGGGLRVNRQSAIRTPEFHSRIYSNALALTAILKSRLNIHTEMLSRARVTSHTAKVVPIAAPAKSDGRILPMSYFGQNGIAHSSLSDAIQRRRRDYQFWQNLCLGNSSLRPLFPELPRDVCPLGFPVAVTKRTALEARARKAGIPLSVHWRLDHGLTPECRNSLELSRQMLTLPVYSQLREKDRETLAGIIMENWG